MNWKNAVRRIETIRQQAEKITIKRAKGVIQIHPEALELRRLLDELAQEMKRPRRPREKRGGHKESAAAAASGIPVPKVRAGLTPPQIEDKTKSN